MKVAFKQPMSLKETKRLFATVKAEGGKVTRVSSGCAILKDSRNRDYTLSFKSNLELRQLIK